MFMHLVPVVDGTTQSPHGAQRLQGPAPELSAHPRSADAAPEAHASGTSAPGSHAGGRGTRKRRPLSPGDALLREDPGVQQHLRRANLAAVPLAILVAVQGFALAAMIVALAEDGRLHGLAAGILIVAAALRGAAAWALERSGRQAAGRAIGRLRSQLVTDAATLAVATPGALRPGEVAADVVHHLPSIESYLGRFLAGRPTAAATTVVVLIAIALTDPLSAFLLAPTVPILIVFLWLVGTEAKSAADARLQSLQQLGAHLLDVLRGVVDLRSFGRSTHQRTQVRRVAVRYREQTMETLRTAFLSGLVLELVAMLGTALIAVFGGVRLAEGGVELIAILPALVLAPELYAPPRRLGAGYHEAADARAALDRLAAVAQAAAAAPVAGTAGGPAAPRPAGTAITLSGVTVDGGEDRRARLTDVSLTLVPGRATALVGPSGSGKSTLAQLVLGLLPPTAGTVAAGTQNLATLDLEPWRRRCAWVAQDPVLLPATLRDNARLGAPDTTDTALWDALTQAGLRPLAEALPHGLDTVLGEGGARLSSGELRRLALVRAIVGEADLIVLDEPTAQLDALTAERLRGTLRTLRAGRTVLLITHDPALAETADEIVELREGQVVGVRPGRAATANPACAGCSGSCSDQVTAAPAAALAAAAPRGLDAPLPPARPMRLRTALRLLAPDAGRPVRTGVLKAIGFGSLSSIAAVAVLGLSGGLIVEAANQPPVLELTMIIVLVRMFSIVRATTRYGERLASHEAALRMLEGVRVRVFGLVARGYPGSWSDRSSTLLDQAVGDVDRSADLLIRVIVPAAAALITTLVAVTLVSAFDPAAGAAVAAGLLILMVVLGRQARRAGMALAASEDGRAALGREVVTALDAGPELLLAGRTASQVAIIAEHERPLTVAAAQHGTRTAALGGVVSTGSVILAAVVAAVVAPHVAAGELSGAIAAGLVLAALGCAERLDGIVEAGLALPAALAAVVRLAPALLDVDDEPADAMRGGRTLGAPGLDAEGLVVTRGERTIIDGADLQVEPGERVVLTGESGAGKSTLLLALAGLLEPAAGVTRTRGRDVRTLSEGERASTLLLVPSAPHLFGGSLGANLRIAAPGASDRRLEHALAAVGLADWLEALPDGLDTLLGEDGVRASGGERQRIGLARAWLSPAPVVLLDEPASHLPEAAALAALRAVLAAVPGRTAVLVSHRASERTLATREVRLEAGHVGATVRSTRATARR